MIISLTYSYLRLQDIDSDDAAPAQKKKKARPVREEIDDTKLNQKTVSAANYTSNVCLTFLAASGLGRWPGSTEGEFHKLL